MSTLESETADDPFPDEVEYRVERGWIADRDMTDVDRDEWFADVLGVRNDE